MIQMFIAILIFSSVNHLSASKKSIFEQEKFEKHSKEHSSLLIKQAICFVQNQELEKGLLAFLQALDCAPKQSSDRPSRYYDDALKVYLSQTENPPDQVAEKIQKEFKEIYLKNPKETGVGFIVAASEVLKRNYPQFIQTFYDCYLKDSHHYMVFKTIGMVHLKLAKFASAPNEKEKHKQLAFVAFRKALEKNSQDVFLFRLTLLLAPTHEKSEVVKDNLKLILREDTMLSRVDLYPYVKESLSFGYIDLTKKLLEKARTWYPVSRNLDAAEKYFQQVQTKQGG